MQASRTFRFQPEEPLAQKRLVDPGNRAQAPGRVAVHGGIPHGRFAAVARGQQKGVLHVRQQPHARCSHRAWMFCRAKSSVSQESRTAEDLFDSLDVPPHELVDRQTGHLSPHAANHGRGGILRFPAAIGRRLIDAVQQPLHPLAMGGASRGAPECTPTGRRIAPHPDHCRPTRSGAHQANDG